jgi:flagellar basal-body rod protein FlgG
VVFEDLMYQSLRSPGASTSEQTQLPTGLQVGLGARVASTTRHFGQGALQQTGNNFDVAIKGQGFFQITMPDGSTGYTRDGAFQVDSAGQLVTPSGYPVQPGITIPANAQTVTIATDGTVSVVVSGQTQPLAQGQIQLATFINPAGLEPRGGNLFAETAASGTPNVAAPGSGAHGALQQGFVEGSNVNVAEELVSMIATQTSDQMLQRLSQV